MKLLEANTLVIADTHIPFELDGYLDFCLDLQKRVKCGRVVHSGDLVDNHSISYHEHNPNGKSPGDEYKEAKKHLKDWFKAFPTVKLCRGNHDCLVDRKGRTSGMPEEVFRSFREIWELPKGWQDGWEFVEDNVRYMHGTAYSGRYAHVAAAYDSRQSTVIGHVHSIGAVQYIDTDGRRAIFGMNVGSGIDRDKYAFTYGKDFRYKPILGAGVVTDHGRFAQFFPYEKVRR